MVNPQTAVSGAVGAGGCNIGVYFTGEGRAQDAQVFGAVYYGVVVNGDASNASIDVIDSHIYDIGDSPFNGNQRGVGIYFRAFYTAGTATGRVGGNTVELYQKGGIVASSRTSRRTAIHHPPPPNVKAVNNTISGSALQNNYGGVGDQAGPACTVFIDADPSFTSRPKVHGNK